MGFKPGWITVSFLKALIVSQVKKRRKSYPPHGVYWECINVPYLLDNNKQHTYDVYLANESNRKHCLFIDIHGGSFIFGEHQDNYPFAFELLKRGFDVVTTDYVPNNGRRDMMSLIDDTIKNVLHVYEHRSDYGFEDEPIIITGDSAGGYLALFVSELFRDKELAKKFGYELPEIPLIGVVVNCPVYDLERLGEGRVTLRGMKRMLGPKAGDKAHLASISPKTHIASLNVPLFLSTCKNDFIREESIKLQEDCKEREDFAFVDIDSDDKDIDHVHNVIKTDRRESILVNDAIAAFAEGIMAK